jgi:hypothetical protein
MRIPARAVLTACAVVLAAGALAGCTSSHAGAEPTTTAKPTPTPIFTSDADALAAATETYVDYVRASDDIGHDGGAHPERIMPYVTPEGLKHEEEVAAKLASEHSRGYGYTKINNTTLQSREESHGVATVTIYVCQDLSDVDVRDANGVSLVSPDRANFIGYVSTLRSSATGRLVVASNKYWSGGGICKH